MILDVFSRYAVGWTVQHRESAALAKALIAQAAEQQATKPKTLTVHADRGASMTSKPVAFLLADLGVTKSHNRPYTSTDNPYSEAQFKTLKYRPGFPARFDSINAAREFCRCFFGWYNHEHRHSGIGLMSPATVHHGLAEQAHAARAEVLGLGLRGQAREVRPPAAKAAGATERGLDQQARPARHPGAESGQWIGRGALTEARRTAHRAPDFTGRPSGVAKQRLRPRGGCSLNSLTKLSHST